MGLFAAALGLTVIACIISAIYRRAFLRILPCCNKEGAPEIINQILKYLVIFCLTFSYSCLTLYETELFDTVFYFRAFNRLFHNPFAASLETIGLLIYLVSVDGYTKSPFFILFLISLCLHRLMIFGNKCLYVLISIITAYKNTK